MIPARSTKAKKAKAVFFRRYNDIDIYIEDTERGAEKLYAILFQRAFKDKYIINRIYPLGGRQKFLSTGKKGQTKQIVWNCM